MQKTKKQTSESRRTKRFLLRRGERRDEIQSYADNIGNEYDYKWIAGVSSFYNIIMGCFRNGFPILVSKLWYPAWAFYPFFFVRRDLRVKDPIPILNHERIHVRQQRDIHMVVSLPLVVLCLFAELFGLFDTSYLLCSIPFVPTLVYGFEMLRSWYNLNRHNKFTQINDRKATQITFNTVRENTCFERESIARCPNAEYLYDRKFMAVIAFTGWKRFEKYGM